MSVRPAESPSTSRGTRLRSRWLLPLGLFLLFSAVYVATASRDAINISMDVWTANFASWRIADGGDPTIEQLDVPQLDGNPMRFVWVVQDAAGNDVIGRAPGVVAAGVPAYWLSGVDSMALWPGALTAALLSAAAMTMMFLALRTRLTDRQAALVSLVLGLATPVWSVAANGLWPHTVTVLGVAGMAWAATSGRWWLAGIFGGVTLWGRLHAAVIIAVLGLLVAWRRRSWSVLLGTAIPSTLLLALLCVWTRWMYGSWNPTASYDAGAFAGYAADNRFSLTNHLGFWISPDRGMLVWTPVMLLLAPALVRGWRELPDWSRSLVVAGLAYTLVQATFNRFTGGDTFYGYRLGLEFVACATPAFAFTAHRMGSWARRLIGPVLGVQTLAIFVGASLESFYVSSEKAWTENSFFLALRTNLGLGLCVLLISVLLGVLAQRAWERAERLPAETQRA